MVRSLSEGQPPISKRAKAQSAVSATCMQCRLYTTQGMPASTASCPCTWTLTSKQTLLRILFINHAFILL